MGYTKFNPADGRWGWRSQIYDESQHLTGLDRSLYIVNRCKDAGIQAPLKHVKMVDSARAATAAQEAARLAKLPKPAVSPPINWAPLKPLGAYAVAAIAVAAVAFLGWRLFKKRRGS